MSETGNTTMRVSFVTPMFGVFWAIWGLYGFWWGVLYGAFWPIWVGYRMAVYLVGHP